MRPSVKGNLMLMTTAFIWGMGFVAQRVGAQVIGPFVFNALRFALGGFSLIPLMLYFDREKDPAHIRSAIGSALPGGIAMGSVLFAAAALQQIGLKYTTASNAAFITGLYIIIVPFMSVFLKQHIEKKTWFAGIIAVIGLYLMTVGDTFNVNVGDVYELAGSFFWAAHILLIDHFIRRQDLLKLTIIQFLCCAVLSLSVAVLFEKTTTQMVQAAWIPILYGGFISVGIAYTLQVFGQESVKPSHAAIILSFEIVFAAIGAAILLSETFSTRGFIGASLIFCGILISQIRWPVIKRSPVFYKE